MRILAIETASEACSVALFEGAELLSHDHRVLGRGHAESLIPMIQALPQQGRADRIVVSLGPGSFTGVRIGIAAARALGVAWRAEVLGYPTLALVAAQGVQLDSPSDALTVCMNGGHGEWFVQDFAGGLAQGAVQSLTPEKALEAGANRVIVGNRARELADLFDDGRTAHFVLPDAAALHELQTSALTADLSPVYGRAPDATPQKVRPA